ncbi:hypothetical protein BDZ97DRAFT_448095 [Flammula alnicola]|nr:hypothetical protein BDZ97DRAFT_448095 [Flammula alnicola]
MQLERLEVIELSITSEHGLTVPTGDLEDDEEQDPCYEKYIRDPAASLPPMPVSLPVQTLVFNLRDSSEFRSSLPFTQSFVPTPSLDIGDDMPASLSSQPTQSADRASPPPQDYVSPSRQDCVSRLPDGRVKTPLPGEGNSSGRLT